MLAIEKTGNVMYDNKAVLARVLPFTVFVLLIAFKPILVFLNIHSNWHYFFQSLAALFLLLFFRREYIELIVRPNGKDLVLAILLGCLVFFIWIIPYPNILGKSSDGHFLESIAGNRAEFFLFVRFFGSALIVPIIEELFWRSYLTRRLDQVHFEYLEPRYISFFSILISSVLFSLEHQLWFAGLIAGLVYGLLYKYAQNLWLPILAHTTTNTLLGIWILQFEHWEYW